MKDYPEQCSIKFNTDFPLINSPQCIVSSNGLAICNRDSESHLYIFKDGNNEELLLKVDKPFPPGYCDSDSVTSNTFNFNIINVGEFEVLKVPTNSPSQSPSTTESSSITPSTSLFPLSRSSSPTTSPSETGSSTMTPSPSHIAISMSMTHTSEPSINPVASQSPLVMTSFYSSFRGKKTATVVPKRISFC
jgi:hypothetical protein